MDPRAALPNQHAMVDLSRLLFLGALLLTACTAATSPNLYRVTGLFLAYRPGTTLSQS
jgi:hypothetical protein